MTKKTINIRYEVYNTTSELKQEEKWLMEQAANAVKLSYAPYSAFHVGAAVLLENGEVVTAGNQENAAFPSGLCAERVALFYAKSKFPDVAVKAIAITARSEKFPVEAPLAPCGSCRQVIAETEKRQNSPINILMAGQKGPVHKITGIEQLLPFVFFEEKLKNEEDD